MFGIFNLLIGSVYPVIASFKAYDSYSRLATKTGATTFTVKGVSIPLGTILRKATAAEAQIEEDTLNYRLLSVQMWLIYWIVNATVRAAETVLHLAWLPLYSIVRCMFSLWLVAPIMVSSARLKSSQVMSFNDVQQEWADFSSQGCGLVYFRYLRPFFDKHAGLLSQLSAEPLLAYISGLVVLPLAQRAGFWALARGALQPSAGYAETIAGYTGFSWPGRGRAGPEAKTAALEDISDYDVVDRPGGTEEPAARQRAAGQAEPPAASAGQAPQHRQPWFW
ncbi:hypothetical protein METBIDRAFT_190765 [Metschnikowia bicuspidata var. bicuspidata NRRL YB-4993]|uniref:Protein YOP1 n=1 Tax=Metschnikowia bicuspidata var. bicuspidata NRRL YB-4993 TaxID=869754 RepID=A0A1A0HC26_9ASCO|nr:hypothetical protein METBIDRAFT_190765 [Metschnikowia bicuspidata var. bicuspidata NRRL YB-4993]OBA21689.1 hypothetical protein METBIDRAFT_190765 [Metschnikowia bicuspidata var. bicuspidata NRRL YB-4993]